MDLAEGHLAALNYLSKLPSNFSILNLGTGSGCSVLELVSLYEKISQKKIPFEIAPRRPGDIPSCYAAVDIARLTIGWSASRNIQNMCEDSWKWINFDWASKSVG